MHYIWLQCAFLFVVMTTQATLVGAGDRVLVVIPCVKAVGLRAGCLGEPEGGGVPVVSTAG